jgi:hypothetical protein
MAEARRQGTPLPPLLLDGVRCLRSNAIDADPNTLSKMAASAQKIDDACRKAAELQGRDEEGTDGDMSPARKSTTATTRS